MPRVSAMVVLRALTLVALAAASALVVEYRGVDSAFCGAESGCAALRRTDLAYLWGVGVTLPEVGAAGLLLVFGLSFTRARLVAAILALVGGVVGLFMLALQALVLKHFCWLCLSVDISAVFAAAAAVRWLVSQPQREDSPLADWAWLALALLCIAAPAAWPTLRPLPAVPAGVRAYYVPGKINVIEFADFQCPFCRGLHPRLKALIARYGERVHYVRLNMPLESHAQAKGAALAMLCAEPEKAEAFADFLFATEDLSSEAISNHAAELGMNATAFEACLDAPATLARLNREIEVVRGSGLQGLPTTYVGARRIVGAQSDDTFRAAFEAAEAREGEGGVPGWLYLLLVIGASALLIRAGYRSARTDTELDQPTAPSDAPS